MSLATDAADAPIPAATNPSAAASGLVLTAATVALLVLLGWTLHYEPLKRFVPGLTAMNPLTAVCFVFACLALWLGQVERPARGRRLALWRLSLAVVIASGGSKLLDLVAGTALCPDDLLFASQLDAGQTYPSRMAPHTATCFLLLGLALAALDRGRAQLLTASQLLLLPVLLLALFAAIGYLYDTSDFYKLKNFIPIALHTAISFLLLASALLLSRPRDGLMTVLGADNEAGRSLRLLLPVSVLAPIALGWLSLQGQRLQLYALGTGTSLLVLGIVVTIGGLLFYSTLRLYRVEEQRQALDAELAARIAEQSREAEWKTRLAELDERLRASRNDLPGAAAALLPAILGAVGAPMGGLFAARPDVDGGHLLRALALVACETGGDAAALRGGLLEQCARSRRPIELVDLPPSYPRIRAASVELPARLLLLQPVVLDDEVLGVLELALLAAPDAAQRRYLEGATRVLSFLLLRLRETHVE